MKYFVLSGAIIFSTLSAAQQHPKLLEWNADLYAQGNWVQEREATKMLKDAPIDLFSKRILDIGCGTGNITKNIADLALSVHGIDASNNMIEWAKRAYNQNTKLSFEVALAEEYVAEDQFDVVVSFFCLHWVKNIEQALKNIHTSLKPGCEFFGTMRTQEDGNPPHLKAFMNVAKNSIQQFPFLEGLVKNMPTATNFHPILEKDLITMLESIGFEIVSITHAPMRIDLKDRDQAKTLGQAIFLSTPVAQLIPEEQKDSFLDAVIDEMLKVLPQENGVWYGNDSNTVLHLRKK